MESMLYQGHRFLGGIKHFWMAVSVCGRRTSLSKTLHVKNGRKCDQSEGSRQVLSTFDSQNDQQCVEFESPNRPRNFDLRTGQAEICAKLVPKILTNEQKENRRNVCLDLLECIENDKNFFKHVITGDETWIFEYDPDTKRQSSEWHTSNSPRPKKARMSKIKNKKIG